MIKDNLNLQNSLRCLQHPSTLLSITILLLNDHVLKVLYPSWITGKLSDFAGLFFFPILLSAILGIILSKFSITKKTLGIISFGFVIIWFSSVKIIPLINTFTTDLASILLGYRTRFILDPTDLVALLSTIPAYFIWKQPILHKPTYTAYLAFFIASAAVIATSPPYPTVYEVTNLEYDQEGIVYAAGIEDWKETYYPVGISRDGGLTWEDSDTIFNIEQKSLPIKHCSQIHHEICYQITRWGRLKEVTPDHELVTVESVKTRAFDMVIFNWDDQEVVIVAVGEYGIFRRELPDGKWINIPVLAAKTPISSSYPSK
jgi:hypothetical protein